MLFLLLLTFQASKRLEQRWLQQESLPSNLLPKPGLDAETVEDLEERWASWMAEGGQALESDVEEEFLRNRNIFEMDDGTHAKWVKNSPEDEEQLGILLVFSPEEVSELVCAWQDAQDGNMNAGSFVAGWLGHFMEFIDIASDVQEP